MVEHLLDYERLAVELLRALRGRRSRPGFSRHLGYRSNIAQRWETQLCWPTASGFFALCERLRIDVSSIVRTFLRMDPAWLSTAHLEQKSGVGELLSELRGRTPIKTLAELTGHSRFSISRWLRGTAEPSLPELLRFIDASTRRLLDFIALIVDPSTLPTIASDWQNVLVAREGAYSQPLSHAVLRALELDAYKRVRTGKLDYLARKLGVSQDELVPALAFLVQTGQVRKTRRGYRVQRVLAVDTGADPARARALKVLWTKHAVDRLERNVPATFGYSLFAISKRDLQRLREIQLAYVREMQSVIAQSARSECVGLYCFQLFDLASKPRA